MKAYKIHITSWTASFRHPNLISGYQPSLTVPPLSTIYGLISSATGDYVSPFDIALGYVFKFDSQAIDIETIYQVNIKSSPLNTKQNVIRRQVLFDNNLWLYVHDPRVAEAFLNPQFQLLLGRSNDLASVISVGEIELEQIDELTKLKGTIIPMGVIPLSAPIQALPIGFTNEIPRRGIGTRPFFLLEYDYEQPEAIHESGYFDLELSCEIYWHDYREA
ncbi:MAG: type I-B CRISPR-associated protein Cas5 [Deltaproteobacteria bacterium]|nr:type I-B CRISPR-associated protein Cas5 [Deltaproteobacteria bacterium]